MPEVKHLQLTVVHLHDGRDRVGAATALYGQEDLLSRLVDGEVVDGDLIVGRPE